MAKEMNKLDKAALRKIKESGNYGALLKFKRLKPRIIVFIFCIVLLGSLIILHSKVIICI